MSKQRFLLFFVAPTLLLLVLATAPLILGQGTLYHRDVLTGHFPMKAAQAELMGDGELPLIDPYRSAGQPLVGNLNAAPLYPDNLLFLTASPFWALNAHFWIHLLLAPLSFYWLGRRWGLGRGAAWAAGVCYAASGFFLSLFNLYNLVAGAALVPAFIAAALTLCDGTPSRRAWIVAAGLWALLLLAGDPLFALLGGLMAWTAVLAKGTTRHRKSPGGDPTDSADSAGSNERAGAPQRLWQLSWPLALVAVVGTLLAAPQWVELLRILPLSFRGYWQYSPQAALSQSWDPRTLVEWFLPFVFGAPDFSFWGKSFFGGNPPLLYSLYPGLLCWLLVAASGRPRGAMGWWPWCIIGGGLFFASGVHNPIVIALYQIPGAAVLRYPVKMWLLVAVGGALLCGMGFDRLASADGRRRAAWTAGGLALALSALWIALMVLPAGFESWLRGLDRQSLVEPVFTWELAKWRGTCLVSVIELALLALALRFMRRHPALGGGLLLTLHLSLQIFFLSTLIDADEIEPYVERPPVLATLPEEAVIVHGGFHELFGPIRGAPLNLFPDPRVFWLSRSHFAELHPFSGIQWGRRYGFNNSPEGLDSFFSVSMVLAMPRMQDDKRVRLLRASGIDILLLPRPLVGVGDEQVQLLGTFPSAGHSLHVYGLEGPLPPALITADILRAPHMDGALDLLTEESFDPRRTAVLPASPSSSPATRRAEAVVGEILAVEESVETLKVTVRARGDSLLVTRRAFLPIYRATVDGVEATPLVANAHRLAVAVPDGEHDVRLWVDRRPFHWALIASAVTVGALLLFLALGIKKPKPAPDKP